ncbi:MAG: helix-hairpin-helix domain-containing protein [Acidimicrobiia bacterium]
MGRVPNERAVAVGLALVGAALGGLIGVNAGLSPVQGPPLRGAPEVLGSVLVPVHVSGWVTTPGVVWVTEGSLVIVAIDAAGGARVGARLDLINLAQPVFEGDQLQVPGPEAGVDATGGSAPGDGLIDINTADEIELQSLPGVGPVLAGRIVAHRDTVGRFESVEDLLDVVGIGEAKLASIRDLIRPP